MKAKTIEKVLSKKINAWLESITDPTVREHAKKDTIVTGGSIASMLLNEQVNDFDIYFRTKQTTKLVSKYYADKTGGRVKVIDGADFVGFKPELFYNKETDSLTEDETQFTVFVTNTDKDRIKLFIKGVNFYRVDGDADLDAEEIGIPPVTKEEEKDKYLAKCFTSNAITLTDQIQLVIRFHGEPEELHKNYDFVHATNYYDHKTGKVTLRPEAILSLLNKELKYIGSLYPVTSIIRTKKFIKRGWNISAGTYLKIMFQISELDLTDIKVLEEQISGIDVAFFGLLLEALSNVEKTNLTYEYISTLIDKIFE